jgi:hypothetical protein
MNKHKPSSPQTITALERQLGRWRAQRQPASEVSAAADMKRLVSIDTRIARLLDRLRDTRTMAHIEALRGMVGAAVVCEQEVYGGHINLQHPQGTLTEVKRTRGVVDFGGTLVAVPPCEVMLPPQDDEPIDLDDPGRRATKWGYTAEEIYLVIRGLQRPPAEAHDDAELI